MSYRASFRSVVFVPLLVAMGCKGEGGLGAGGQGGTSAIGGTTTTIGTTVAATGGVIGTGARRQPGRAARPCAGPGRDGDRDRHDRAGTGGATATGGVTTTGGAVGTGGTAATAGCDKDLSGTWDLFASSTGTGVIRGTLVVSKDGFSFTASSSQLVYTGTGTKSATWKYNGNYGPTTRLISVQNTPAMVDSGSLPLALGGQWTLTSNSETGVLNVAPGSVTGKCTGRATDHNVGGDDWPFEPRTRRKPVELHHLA